MRSRGGSRPIGDAGPRFAALRVVLLLSLAGIALSAILLLNHYGLAGGGVCSISETWSCDVVNRSPYSVLAGIPVALLGLLGFAALFAIAYSGAFLPGMWIATRVRPLLLVLSATGVAFATYLTAIEVLVLRALCPLCVAAFAVDAAILGVTALWVPSSLAADDNHEDVPIA